MKGIVIKQITNEVEKIEIESNGKPLYDLMHEVVDGYYQNVYLKVPDLPDAVMIVNEEALMLWKCHYNAKATKFTCDFGYSEAILGNALILKLGKFEDEPDVVGLTDEEAEKIIRLLELT